MLKEDGYVPVTKFGKDHWSTLAYMETVMVECGGFQVGFDCRMRQARRNTRVMLDECRSPKRTTSFNPVPPFGWDDKWSTFLGDGSQVMGHDDWDCVQDMAAAGFLSFRKGKRAKVAAAEDVQPKVVLHLSDLGRAMADRVRAHKAKGGSFANFKFTGAA